MLDTAATALEITSKHSPSCELNKYVDKHRGISSLQIEDVRTLMSVDRAVFPEMIPVISYTPAPDTTNHPQHSVMEMEQRSTTDSSIALHVVPILPVITLPNLHYTMYQILLPCRKNHYPW